MAIQVPKADSGASTMSVDASREFFESEVQRRLGISGQEFFSRLDAGEYRDTPDSPEYREILRVALLIPFGRSDS